MEQEFNKENLVNHWIKSSDKDFKTMEDLFRTRNNNWALFLGHLVIEKLLKALYVKTKSEYPPMIHDLRRIYEKCELHLDPEIAFILDTITRFNINARYDDYKQTFDQLCTDSFTKEWIEKTKECRLWIRAKL